MNLLVLACVGVWGCVCVCLCVCELTQIMATRTSDPSSLELANTSRLLGETALHKLHIYLNLQNISLNEREYLGA